MHFALDLYQPPSPWGALNLARSANYLWKGAHSHSHQFGVVLKRSWASPDRAPISDERWRGSGEPAVQGSSSAVHCGCSALVWVPVSVFITSHDLELILLPLCCFLFSSLSGSVCAYPLSLNSQKARSKKTKQNPKHLDLAWCPYEFKSVERRDEKKWPT